MASAMPVLPEAVALGRLDERQSDPVLYRTRRVEALELGENRDVGLGRQRADVDDGGASDEIEDRREARH
jgi:hypothetical protein